jgi:hypothetical protein
MFYLKLLRSGFEPVKPSFPETNPMPQCPGVKWISKFNNFKKALAAWLSGIASTSRTHGFESRQRVRILGILYYVVIS